jgi:hypothetical protein
MYIEYHTDTGESFKTPINKKFIHRKQDLILDNKLANWIKGRTIVSITTLDNFGKFKVNLIKIGHNQFKLVEVKKS